MLFKFHTCTLNRVYGYVRVQLVANSFEPLYCTLSNVLYRVSVQCTVQCPMYCTVPNVLYSVLLLYNVQCTVQCVEKMTDLKDEEAVCTEDLTLLVPGHH